MSEHTDQPRPGGPDDRPTTAHTRPPGVDDATVAAVGKLSEALETAEQARGNLYAFHQLTGKADLLLGEAADALREAGHTDQADLVEREIVGRNVIPGHWTFQIVESYNATYHRPFTAVEQQVRDQLVDGRDHLHEAEMKENRRTHGHPHHTAGP
ncbi:hypothetical protein [Streptomyces bohaiensis]|uniref:Uncharacterized protein n=1 Tax=Streptomyces bohaiensis TaxID=1431344 RepID=A0ABX1CHG1_9ACTN|nr:hypothetical protein [Streptomyces bohaiensis]NJQ17801.1 hypothetical protein [Streptomyces bohaiensis]